MERQRRAFGRRTAVRVGLLVMVVLATVALSRSVDVAAHIGMLRSWVRELGVAAPSAYVVGYVVATLLWVPGTPLTVLAAILFGPRLALIVMIVASTLTAIGGFLIARYLARTRLERLLGGSRIYQSVQRTIDTAPLFAVPFARLFPAFPFIAVNYAFGLSRMSLWKYLVTSELVMIPMNVVWVFSSAAVYRAAIRGETPWAITLGTLGAALVLAAVGVLAYRATRGRATEASPSPRVEEGDLS